MRTMCLHFPVEKCLRLTATLLHPHPCLGMYTAAADRGARRWKPHRPSAVQHAAGTSGHQLPRTVKSGALPDPDWGVGLPEGWLECPPMGRPVGFFIPIKVRNALRSLPVPDGGCVPSAAWWRIQESSSSVNLTVLCCRCHSAYSTRPGSPRTSASHRAMLWSSWRCST